LKINFNLFHHYQNETAEKGERRENESEKGMWECWDERERKYVDESMNIN
jgi:hypothetical protein